MSRAAPTQASPDLTALRRHLQANWASGEFSVIGATFQIVGENLVESADVKPGEELLDVAAGSTSAKLAAARRYAHVTSTDFVPSLLDRARERAHEEALPAIPVRQRNAAAVPELLERSNTAGAASLVVPGTYLEAVITPTDLPPPDPSPL